MDNVKIKFAIERIVLKILLLSSSQKIIIVFGLISLFLAIASHNYLTFELLFKLLNKSRNFIEEFKLMAGLLYILAYCLIVMFSIPVASFLTILSGYIFGGLLGGLIAFTGALIGSSLLFIIVRSGIKLNLEERLRSNSKFEELSTHIYQNQFRYLLFLRFFPIFPFWMVNLAPAILNIKFRVVFLTTFLGILPGTFIIAGIGEQVRIISKPSSDLIDELILNPQFIGLFFILSFFTIFPTLIRVIRLKKQKKTKRFNK